MQIAIRLLLAAAIVPLSIALFGGCQTDPVNQRFPAGDDVIRYTNGTPVHIEVLR